MKQKRKPLRVITVVHSQDRGVWLVLGGRGYYAPYKRKADAVKSALSYAKKHGKPGRGISVRIKGKDGRYTEERTYPRSEDPRRSKG